jgi:WD40 repeat protein
MKAPSNPFPGPVPLTEQDRLFGRERETLELADRIVADRIVMLYSPSGAGKSSLINAGLLPKMRERGVRTRKPLRVSLEAPHGLNRYIWSCATSLGAGVEGLRLTEYLGDDSDDELFIFDQFEEILTTDPFDEAARVHFFEQLGQALRVRSRYALFAIREEYLAPLDQYLDWLPTQLSSRMRLSTLGVKAARAAIVSSISATGTVTIEDAAADALIKDLATGGWVEPVQLQVVCNRLWHKLPEGTLQITSDMVSRTGNTDNALEAYFDDVVKNVATASGIGERAIRDWFGETLISPAGTRQQIIRGDRDTGGLANTAVLLLEGAHLVRSEVRGNVVWRELTHDRLIRPIVISNTTWKQKNLSLLQSETELWIRTGSSHDRLLRGDSFREAKAWARTHGAEVTEDEHEYLRQSERALRAENVRKALVAGCFAAMAMMLFWAARTLLVRRVTGVGQTAQAAIRMVPERPDLAAALALQAEHDLDFGGPLLAFAVASDHHIAAQAVRSAFIAATAQHNPVYFGSLPAPADFAATCLWVDDRGIPFASDKAGQNVVMLAPERLSWSKASGISAPGRCKEDWHTRKDLAPGWEMAEPPSLATEVELADRSRNVVLRIPTGPVAELKQIAMDPAATKVVWSIADRRIYWFDIPTGRWGQLSAGDVDPVVMKFNGNGNVLAVGGRENSIHLWYFWPQWTDRDKDPIHREVLRGHNNSVYDVGFSPDGSRLISTDTERFIFWTLEPPLGDSPRLYLRGSSLTVSPQPPAAMAVLRDGPVSVVAENGRGVFGGNGGVRTFDTMNDATELALSRNGQFAAVARAGAFQVVDLRSGAPAMPEKKAADDFAPRSVTVSEDGKLFAWAGLKGLRFWKIDGTVQTLAQGSSLAIAFRRDTRLAAAGDYTNNRIDFWELKSDGSWKKSERSIRTDDAVIALAFSFDGKLLASLDLSRNLQFWDVATRRVVGGAMNVQGDARDVAFSEDGRTLHVLFHKNRIRDFSIDPARFRDTACRLAPRTADEHLTAMLEGRPYTPDCPVR